MFKIKSFGRRFALAVLCFTFIFCIACPAFASSVEAGDLENYVLFDYSVHTADFTFYDDDTLPFYSCQIDICDSYTLSDSPDVYLTFNTFSSGLEKAYSYFCGDFEGVTNIIGNPYLICSCLPNNGSNFAFAWNEAQEANCIFSLSESLYNELVSGSSAESAFTLRVTSDSPGLPSDNPQEATRFLPSLLSGIGSVFNSAMSMVGSVANTVATHPILYLPIIIGLCGIGVAFFKRLKQ